ncbi:MAG: transcription antitermination factor NusB [Micropepsaceae bacterium]
MSDNEKPRQQRRSGGRSRSASRLAVVQALYQMEMSGQDSESAITEFIDHRMGQEIEGDTYAEADHKYFAGIVRGVVERQEEIDRALARATGKNWHYDRIDTIMRAILRASSYEFLANASVPVRVLVNEYLNVASAFYEEKGEELTFISGNLYRIAREFRPEEVAALDQSQP